MKKILSLILAGSLLGSNAFAEDKVKINASSSKLELENKSASDENGSYDGGVFNRVSLGCYHSKNGSVAGENTRGFQYNLVYAFGKSSFENDSTHKKTKRIVNGFWPAVSYRLNDKLEPYFRIGAGAIPFVQIEHRRAGRNHHANYYGGEIIVGAEFELEKILIDLGFLFTYGYLKKMSQSDNEVRDIYRLPEEIGFYSLGISVGF